MMMDGRLWMEEGCDGLYYSGGNGDRDEGESEDGVRIRSLRSVNNTRRRRTVVEQRWTGRG